MRIAKWHETRGKRLGERANSRRKTTPERDVITHYIEIDGEAYERLCVAARARRITVHRLVDDAINFLLNREAV